MGRSQSFENDLVDGSQDDEPAPGVLLPGDWKESVFNAVHETSESEKNALVSKLMLHYIISMLKGLFKMVMTLHTIYL